MYVADYGTVKAKLKEEMDYDTAEGLGRAYCHDYGYSYAGTYTSDNICEEEMKLRNKIYGNQ